MEKVLTLCNTFLRLFVIQSEAEGKEASTCGMKYIGSTIRNC